MIAVAVKSNLDAFTRGLQDYATHRNIPMAEALAKKSRDVSFRLYELFKAEAPVAGLIHADAKRRGFRTRISKLAFKRADRFMTGQSRILGRVTGAGLRTTRIGKRGKRIIGGRYGTGGTAAPLDVAQHHSMMDRISRWDNATRTVRPGQRESVMNRSAVAQFYELQKREAGRGFLAVSWLPKRWRRVAQAKGGGWVLQRRNKVGTLLGWAEGRSQNSPLGSRHRVTLTSNVGAARKFPHVIAAALDGATRDMAKYFSDRNKTELANRILARIRTGGVQ